MQVHPETLICPAPTLSAAGSGRRSAELYSAGIAYILVEVLYHLGSLRLLALCRLSEKDAHKCLPCPISISPEGKVPTYLRFCFSPVSFSQQLGSRANDCNLFGDDSGPYFKAQVYKKRYSRKTIF